MSRSDLERLSKEELIELVLRLHRPEKTSRTSSKPPAGDRKERREKARPGGAEPGHEGHKRALSADPDQVVEHRPASCSACGEPLPAALPAEVISVHERIDLPLVRPTVEQHRRLCVTCPACRTRVAAPRPADVAVTPFGPRLHAVATYLKTFQALSYERLQAALSDLFGLMNLLRRAQGRFTEGRDAAQARLRQAPVVASDETGVRIEGANSSPASPDRTGRRTRVSKNTPWVITHRLIKTLPPTTEVEVENARAEKYSLVNYNYRLCVKYA